LTVIAGQACRLVVCASFALGIGGGSALHSSSGPAAAPVAGRATAPTELASLPAPAQHASALAVQCWAGEA
jgi:hypothetical protein